MMEIIKAILFGIVEGITEWLPISSTGHMILFQEFVKLNVSEAFWDVFLVVIQLGAILAVVVLFWDEIWPFEGKGLKLSPPKVMLWAKIIFACIPAAVIGLLFEEHIDALFFNYQTVAIALIVFGIGFLWIEHRNKGKEPVVHDLAELSFKQAFLIGLFQLIAAVFPGTSRSGATILGGILIGTSRKVAAEFTFFLAIPVMFGASLLKMLKFGLSYSAQEVAVLGVGMVTAFVVSVIAIKFLMSYIKKHDFKVFGWYRIALGILVLVYFMFIK